MIARVPLRPWYVAAIVLVGWAIMYTQHPLGGDQGILLWVGDTLRGGGLPYRDTFEIRGPAFDYIHALIVAVFGRNEWGIRVFDLLVLALGAWLVWRITHALLGRAAATASSVLFLLWYAAVDYWSTAQSDGWTGTILAAVVALLVPAERRLTLWRVGAAGALVALCTLNKPLYAVFLLLPLVRTFVTRERGVRWLASMWIVTGVAFAVPILLCVAWFAAHGALDDLIEVHILFTVSEYSDLQAPWLTRFQAAIGWILSSKFAVALAVSLGGLVFLARKRRADALVIGTWLLLGVLVVLAQGKYWEYQWLIIYQPLGVLAGIGVHALLSLRDIQPPAATQPAVADAPVAARSMATAALVLIFVAALFPPALEVYRWTKVQLGLTNAQEYDRLNYGPYGRGPMSFVAVARYIAAQSTERDEVFVWGTVQGINFLSGRRSPSRFSYMRALTRKSAFQEKYVREFFDVMRAKPPTYVVALREGLCDVPLRSGPSAVDHIAFPLSCLSDFPDLQRFVNERYTEERAFGAFLVLRRRR